MPPGPAVSGCRNLIIYPTRGFGVGVTAEVVNAAVEKT